jgi:hypothetical protein
MKYLLLIDENEANWAKVPEAERGKIYQEYRDYPTRSGARRIPVYEPQPSRFSVTVAGSDLLPAVSTATTENVLGPSNAP